MAKDNAEGTADQSGVADDLHELRQAVLDLGKALRVFGRSRLAEIGESVTGDTQELADEGRQMLRTVERRVGQLEKMAEKSVREHPGAWATGLLGVLGFGLVLGLILRRAD